MSTEEKNVENGQEPVKKKKLLTVVIAVALGLLAGGGAGAFAAGSLLPKAAAAESKPAAEKPAAPDEEHADEDADHGAEEGEEHAEEETEEGASEDHASSSEAGGDHGAAAGGSPTYLMENLVLNPAGTGGTRFLMVSAAFGLKDEASVETMKTRDHEIRDAMLSVLGTKTVGQLADVAMRDSIKAELKKQVGGLFPKGTVKRVYFPQFVIQ